MTALHTSEPISGNGGMGTTVTGCGGPAALDAAVRAVAETLRSSTGTPRRIRVRCGEASIEVDWRPGDGDGPPSASGATAPSGATPAAASGHVLTAPLVGTFYRAPEPGARPFVEVGDQVVVGQQVGIVEAMKLMNPLEADQAGRVTEILVGDAEPVEYGQPLLRVEPDEE
ncbi:acetyl-CoA carboxylase biotin carboxyl carrier protein [Actinoalloteichus sp. AHMU CJ021]|uniref:Biotin carboxyl carrier protein of acetyl-CoA carboxylase n=1 Tax=Actinoalloteichus caeruleus DSM 43889 TaxID=1120930 RepID=A0ABT1JGB0_ACTCY|nr:acetyl-CoA carboxylase biotin carboxyl carrier protein [Actinoalloteichus caeruleus]AUS77401.1 acetyl-CoA carboxylase biotin carboxyl carrier protein [Actinoalloteichus sp. AHMU CJ021]MCP2331229.1 acetyl-CoA carboxylase biotin carboxyl carrier protein [Actinoalloteichus caeruleus DSM 43889]